MPDYPVLNTDLELSAEELDYFNKWDKRQEKKTIEAIIKQVEIEGGEN